MNKQEFIDKLHRELKGLPQKEVEDRIAFFCEAIDDRTEDGMSEEAAVLDVGPIDTVVKQIISEIPLSKIVKNKLKPKDGVSSGARVLLAVSSIIWVPLLISALAVIFSLFVAIWAVISSLWASFAALLLGGVGGVLLSAVLPFLDGGTSAVFVLGAGLVSLGVSVFFFFGCVTLTKLVLTLTKKGVIAVKKLFIRKDENND